MELRQLEYFVAVAEELHFSRGAQRVHVVQSAVSTAVAKLERELGIELFDRSKPRISLTAAGESFLTEARATLRAARRARDSVSRYRGRLSGTVDVGILMSTGPIDLPAALGRFHHAHPLVEVRLRQNVAGSTGHTAAVADGTLDLALVAAPAAPSAHVALNPLAEEPLLFLCGPTHALASRTQITLDDLARESLVRFAQGWGIRTRTDLAFADAGIDPPAHYEVSNYDTAAGLVRHGLGATLMPTTPARHYTDLRAIPVTPAILWTLSLATTNGGPLSAAAAGLASVLVDQAEQLRSATESEPAPP